MSFNLDNLKKHKFSFFEDMRKTAHHLDDIFKLIDETWDNPPPNILQFLYVPNFNDRHINCVKNFLINSAAKKKLENLWNSNIGVCNIRAYRFTNNPPREKTHYLDILDHSLSIKPHCDALPKGTLKIMILKSKDSKHLTLDHGVIELKLKNEWIPAIGKSPVAILFPPNIVLHRAVQPAPGKIRDAIELTIMRRKADDFLVESSGAHAGYPKDLDAWNKIT